ncbi:MAG: hypothetical protein ACOYMB_05135 [Patescibacteria group bacterium]
MKKIISLTLLVAVLLFAAVPIGKTKNKSYYSGDAIDYNGQLVVASANTNSLEIFKLTGSDLERVSRTRPLDTRFNQYGSYYEVKLSKENGSLYAYAITDFRIDKYNISALNANPILENKISNTYWEWYGGMEKLGNDNYFTIGNKGVKLLNKDLQVIDSYDFKNSQNQYNIQASEDGRYLIDITGNTLRVFDRQNRNVVSEIALNYSKNTENRRATIDNNGNIFVTDDFYAKKFSLDGTLKASFRHLDQPAYDTVISGSSLYFSNGVGIVKLDKDNLKLLNFKYTSSYGGNGWAMGLKAVSTNNGDRIVSFNNSGILVLNQNLEKISFFVGDTNEDETIVPVENLWIKTDTFSAKEGATVKLTGGGFSPSEKLVIYFDGLGNQEATTDSQGRFTSDLKVPPISSTPKKIVDIKVVGNSSKLSYSSSFTIEK